MMNPIATVITAVWHQQSDKESLLRGHMENLRKQTVPFQSIYVFDANDVPPAELEGTKIMVSDALTIYQAWNVALAMVTTPLVMNLNVDDRLAPDAIEVMSKEFDDQEVFLVGGDWKICFSEADTDDVRSAYPVAELPYYPEWPPVPGRVGRLGSGDHPAFTLGPATMWRMKAHLGMPRYPYRFADGSLIRVIGDFVWWSAIKKKLKGKVVRLPLTIGNYRSDPTRQAEFRYSATAEHNRHDVLLL